MDGLEEHASEELLRTGLGIFAYNPLSVIGRSRNVTINLILGVPDEDGGEIQYRK